jgi:hypothetical protein
MKAFDIRNILGTKKKASPYRSYPNTLLRGLIGSLNLVFNPETGKVDPDTYRDISTIESIFTKLFTEDDLKKFLFLKNEGENTVPMKLREESEDFSFKKWLDLLVNKIKGYDAAGDASKAGALIAEAQDKLGSYKDYTFTLSEKKFSKGEIRPARAIFEVISMLFGHMTLRLTFMHMIDYYNHNPVGQKNKFKIDFYSILSLEKIRDYLNDFNIITSSQYRYNVPLTSDTAVANHLFSLFFLDSYIRLPIESFKTSDSAPLFFGYSPLSFVESSLTAQNHLEFNQEIQNQFFEKYYNYKKVRDAISLRNTADLRFDLFEQSSHEMLSVLKEKIKGFIEDTFKDKKYKNIATKKRTVLLNILLMAAESGVFSLQSDSFRFDIENLIIGELDPGEGGSHYGRSGNKYCKVITFDKILYESRPVKINLNKDDFNGKDIIIWRTILHDGKEITAFFDFYRQNLETIRRKSSTLKEIISDNGGKVRIYVAQNHGPDKGYHVPASKYFEAFLPPRQALGKPYQRITLDANRFDLDLADPNIDKKIEYIIALSLCYEKEHQMDSIFFMTQDEIKVEGKDIPIWLYDSFICAFDRHRFYKPSEIYSSGTVGLCKPLAFTKVEDGAILRQKHVKEWERFDLFFTTYYFRILDKEPFFRWW